MQDTITLDTHGLHAQIAAHPVTAQAYRTYLRVTGRPLPSPLARAENALAPVTYVAHVDAVAYLKWLGAQDGLGYRLPSMEELLELSLEITLKGISGEVWPHSHEQRPELRGGLKAHYLCEWTGETDRINQLDDPSRERILGSVFYPPWLREGANASHAQAYFLATEGYSFITFRAARGL